ncbi:DEAD/DEAH box helicase [Corynebacterium sp. 11A]|uniref:DEAD/DEAH box helicase n=1 Tax=Corynebacterium sp. 11A TaxID=2080510 RepID=UPI00124C1DBC|nr:DEAD/DEAH box helicase [Corynebacterium sp. 11A]
MSSIIPTHASNHIIGGLSEYLATSFSLAEQATAAGLKEFLTNSEEGMFHGPYVRTRLPYAPASDWSNLLGWLPEHFLPYRHQAEAFRRLASSRDGKERRPEPTLVVTGTGSGKTESFLYPILDHCLRTTGRRGMKALILYPMNALANDQAARLAELITTDPRLGGIRAGIYTGETADSHRRTVSEAGLITDRETMRLAPPEILLTNYKMLDQLLLRDEDQQLWKESATSLQYVVLDEFHTYDGAQGTDVALLLRRMGLKIKALQPEGELSEEDKARPLGRITPVATSATLGDNNSEPTEMLEFAHTIFGEQLPPSSVVRETVLTIEQWQRSIAEFTGIEAKSTPAPTAEAMQEMNRAIEQATAAEDHVEHDRIVRRVLGKKLLGLGAETSVEHTIAAASRNEWVLQLLQATSRPVAITESFEKDETPLDAQLFHAETLRQLGADAATFIAHTLTLIAHLRAEFGALHGWHGKKFPGVETHLWVREVSRIDRAVELNAAGAAMFRWSDNGTTEGNWLPACYCRNCGRSGWMVSVQPGDERIETNPKTIRGHSVRKRTMMRPLIDASSELRLGHDRLAEDHSMLAWLDLPNAQLSVSEPEEEHLDFGGVVRVLTYGGEDVDELARQNVCPSCGERDSIRFLGSSVATLLSVAVSNLFGMDDVDAAEKKSLVFTDSVQDAAHRAGFMQSRARTFAFRGRTNAAIDHATTLDTLPKQLIASADADEVPARSRFELLPPWVAENKRFAPFWDPSYSSGQRGEATKRLTKVLELDVALEFGDRADLPRSLVSTGTVSVGVDVDDAVLEPIAKEALRSAFGETQMAAFISHDPATGDALDGAGSELAWARGLLEYTRLSGGIYTELLRAFIKDDGNEYMLYRREAAAQGVPRFPQGGAPHFPRAGGKLAGAKSKNSVLPLSEERGWCARWSAAHLSIDTRHAAWAVTALFRLLAAEGIVSSLESNTGATMYYLEPSRIRVVHEPDPGILECSVCHRRFGVDAHGRELLAHTPCHSLGCEGRFEVVANPHNYYRSLYSSRDSRTVISREHTSLLATADRLEIEEQFKAAVDKQQPDAPNVLVATPTLEMGIDIGDLSTVMLASLPESVASYVQRVGRAGRLSGNSLVIAVTRGRGKALARLERPLSTINGVVQPPAAFLSAREILHRQFLAYVIDTMDFAELDVSATRAKSVFGYGLQDFEGTVVAALIDRIEAGIDAELDAFLDSLGEFAPQAVKEELREWASTQAVAVLRESRSTWQSHRAMLMERKKAVHATLDELNRVAESNSADEETELQLRQTRAAANFINSQLTSEFEEEYWIAVMERAGLLPNFTLLDETVEFHLSISRTDADTGEIETHARDYSRGISSALFELAPDATFYAQGIAATVDSVELGPDNAAVQRWRLCPSCSYSRVETPDSDTLPCPHCGDARFADAAQVINVVEMTRVYASVDYSRSAITDAKDDRTSVRFERALSMVVPEGGYGEGWFLRETGFGIRYLPSVNMRWLNLGRAQGGMRQSLCGAEVETPMFRVCRECGHKDSEAGSNHWRDHKPWCSLRNAADEDTIAFALGRTLTTQGVLMHLPPSIAAADENATPSLIATIRMGFKLALGGNPDHLDVAPVHASTHGKVSPMLLLHDTIPGGTGYLSQFTSSADIRRLLLKAYEKLEHCPCQNDQRQACPECLLPFSAGSDVDKTSRESALAAITKILVDDLHPDDSVDPLREENLWEGHITEEAPEPDSRSALEVMFLEQLRADLKAKGARVQEQTVGNHARWTISFPNSPHQWTMHEQKDLVETKPDFYFETDNATVSTVAAYLDGYQYHASQLHNRVAGDITKRSQLARRGMYPWSITYKDLEARRATATTGVTETPRWYVGQLRGVLNEKLRLQDSFHELLLRDPMTQLLEILHHPTHRWDKLGEAAAFHISWAAQEQGPQLLGPAVDLRRVDKGVRISFIPDQEGSDKDSWNRFLRISNLGFLSNNSVLIDVCDNSEFSAVEAAVPAAATAASPAAADTSAASHTSEISDAWAEVLEEWDDDEEAVAALRVLARAGVAAPENIGEEIDGVSTIAVWELEDTEQKLALLFDDNELAAPWLSITIAELSDAENLPEVVQRLRE